MSDRVQRVLSHVIAIGMVAAVAAMPTVAQEADPNAERIFELAGVNADKVDGRHAIKYTTTKSRRAGKLVATNSRGFLPPNIVKPKWGLIQGKPRGFQGYTAYRLGYTESVGDDAQSFQFRRSDDMLVEADLMPLAVGDEIIVIEKTIRRVSDRELAHFYRVKRHPSSVNATVEFNIHVPEYPID